MNKLNSFFKIFFFYFLVFFALPGLSQNNDNEYQSDIFSMMKGNSTFEARKKTRKFFRILNSKKLPSETKSNIFLVLKEFDQRGLTFNYHYIKFFNLFLLCQDSDKNKIVFDELLNFLITNKNYTNIQLKHLFTDIGKFLEHGILNAEYNYTWKCVGDFKFSFEIDGHPSFKFMDSELSLSNSLDTILIFNAKGRYDVIDNIFYGESGASVFLAEDVLIDFQFNEFKLNLNQIFFNIENTSMNVNGLIKTNCLGQYQNKLTSSESYPIFNSYLDNIESIIFSDFSVTSSIDSKGSTFFFNKYSSPVELEFIDDKIEYAIYSDNFKLKDDQMESAVASFYLNNRFGSLYHPSVKFAYSDSEKKIFIERLSGKRGLNPIRNTCHGLNIFADKLEIDLVYDNCLFYHYSRAADYSVLFESDNYFDKDRYRDIVRMDLDPLSLLLDFCELDTNTNVYMLNDFARFAALGSSDALNILLELELFGFIDYNSFNQIFNIKTWAYDFQDSNYGSYDYDSFRIESIASFSDVVAEMDLLLNTMEIYRVDKMKITNRFNFNIYPMSKKIKFFKDKSFSMDGNIDIGSFAFSGNNIVFDYSDFAFYFSDNSILSFMNNNLDQISSSLLHFDDGALYVDTVKNRSGKKKLNDFPKFTMNSNSFLSYNNNPFMFLIHPFELKYLNDMSLTNISFPGNLFLDGQKSDLQGLMSFNNTNNLETFIRTDSIDFYRGRVNFDGELFLSEKGLFANGIFTSDYINFSSSKIELLYGEIIGIAEGLSNGYLLNNTPFSSKNPSLLNFVPYDNEFLLKSIDDNYLIYNKFSFFGDLYFDSENLNGSGALSSDHFNITSSHYLFSKNEIIAADADFIINQGFVSAKNQFISKGSSVEYDLLDNSFFIIKNTIPFSLPSLEYVLDFDFAFLELDNLKLDFSNNSISKPGFLSTPRYGKKKSFTYEAFSASYDLLDNECCVEDGIQLELKKYWLQPNENRFCILENGDFPVFKNSTLIKKRWLLKDKLINNIDVLIKPNLKHLIIAN